MVEHELVNFIEKNPIVIWLIIAIVIGFIHGLYLGKRLLDRIDKRRKYTPIKVFILLLLVIISVGLTIEKFVNPKVFSENSKEFPTNIDEIIIITKDTVENLGTYGVISLSLPILVSALGTGSKNKRFVKNFMIITGVTVTISLALVTFGGVVPDNDAIMIFISYQMGIVFGVFFGANFIRYIIK